MSREIVTTVYTFDELTAEAQQRAVDDWNASDDMPFLSDDMHEYAGELLKKYGFKSENASVFYSLSYSQGDGAMLTGDFSYRGYTFTVEHYGHYYHYNSKQITEITRNNGQDISDATWSKMFNEFEPKYVELCKELEKYGYDLIESAQEFDNVADLIRANEYEFTAEGKMI